MDYKLKQTESENAFNYGLLLKRIFPYIKPVMGRVLLNLAIAVPLGLLDGVVALSLKPYLDYVVNGDPQDTWTFMGHTVYIQAWLAAVIPFGIVAFALFQGILKYVSNYLTDWTGNKISNSLKVDLFKKLTKMDPQFYDVNSSGVILARFLTDPDTASKDIINNMKSFIATFFGLIGLVGVLLYNSWQLAIIGVTVMGIAITPVTLIRKRIKKVSNANMVVSSDMNTNFNETFAGNKIVTAYNLESEQNHKFENQINEQFQLVMSLTKRVGWMSPIMYFVCSIGIALVMAYGNHLILSGQMTAGSFASFVTSLLLLYKPTKTLGNTLTNLQTTFVAMGRVFELFDLHPNIKSSENAVKMNGLNNSIEFKNVSFEYEPETPVLKNFSLKVNKNETIALVGESGSGKTTILNMLIGFILPSGGQLMLDGKDMKGLNLRTYRRFLSVVPQTPVLFTGTVRENITYGLEHVSEEQIAQAVEAANLSEVVKRLPQGLDTMIEEHGANLSGGQRQRISIARALIRNPQVIILDEATSALDSISESEIQEALERLTKGRTTFIVAHRLSTVRGADRILVIGQGRIREQGSYQELMAKKGEFYQMEQLQRMVR